MELILAHIDKNKYKEFLFGNIPIFMQTLGEDYLNNALFRYYMNENYSRDIDAQKPDIDLIKEELKQLFGEKYEYFLDNYLMNILEKRKEFQNVYIYSFIHYLKQPKKLFIDQQLYSKLVSLIFNIQTNAQSSELYQAFLHQFEFKETDLIYYDLKAFIEYKLEMKDEAVKTIQEAYKISVDKYGTTFKSNFDSLRKLDQQRFNK